MRQLDWDGARYLAGNTFRRVESESIPLKECHARVLAEDIYASCDLPFYATSSMDGWAVRGESPWRIVGEVSTGSVPDISLKDSECMKISTGGTVPQGATAVIPWESVRQDADWISGEIEIGDNIRPVGVECAKGEFLFPVGTRIAPAMVGFLAATGHDQIEVSKRLRVAIFFLGDELLHEGVPRDGSIRDALGPVLPSMLENNGAIVTTAHFVKDDLHVLNNEIAKVLADVDIVMTTGGTADGPKDFVKSAIAHLAGRYVIDCVQVRPGYHVLIAAINQGDRTLPFIALPGNPQSAIAAFTSFGKPVMTSMLGAPLPELIQVDLQEKFITQHGFSRLIPGNLTGKTFTPTGFLGSAMLRGVAAASGFALIAPGGDSARWLPLAG